MIGVGRWNSVRLGHTVQTEGQEDRDDSMAPWARGLGEMSGLLWLFGIVVGLILRKQEEPEKPTVHRSSHCVSCLQSVRCPVQYCSRVDSTRDS